MFTLFYFLSTFIVTLKIIQVANVNNFFLINILFG